MPRLRLPYASSDSPKGFEKKRERKKEKSLPPPLHFEQFWALRSMSFTDEWSSPTKRIETYMAHGHALFFYFQLQEQPIRFVRGR